MRDGFVLYKVGVFFSFLNFPLEDVNFYACGCGRSSKFCISETTSLPSQSRGKVCVQCEIALVLLLLLTLVFVNYNSLFL